MPSIYENLFLLKMEKLELTFAKANLAETDECKIKNSLKSFIDSLSPYEFDNNVRDYIATKTLLSTQFPDKDFTDMLNLIKFICFKLTAEENQKAIVRYRLL